MDLKTVRDEARKRFNGVCRVCPICDGRACAGEVPGMGGAGTGESFKENVRALAAVKVHLRVLHDAAAPDVSASFLGMALKAPVMVAPMCNAAANTGGGLTEKEMVSALVLGGQQAGGVGWIGDPVNDDMYAIGLDAIEQAGRGVAIIKPRNDLNSIVRLFEQAEKAGAKAVGVDVDGAGLLILKMRGCPVGPKSKEQIATLVSATKLPFIIKGVMTVDEALLCAEAGVSAIVVSNHGGRVLDHTPGVASVLPDIAAAVKGKMTVLADGGVRTGMDVLKMLALGADAVLVGRPLIVGAYGGGAEGVQCILERFASELYGAMIMTGCARVADISPRVLARPNR